MSSINPLTEQRERAWAYYQHADNLQHQRHNIFIVAQSIFFAAYAQDASGVGPIVAVLGIIYGVLWWYLSQRLSDGMTALSKLYLEPSQGGGGDEVYGIYLAGIKSNKYFSGRTILNVVVPWLAVAAWLAVWVRTKCV